MSSTRIGVRAHGSGENTLLIYERCARRFDAIEDLRSFRRRREARLVLVVDLDGDITRRAELRAGERRLEHRALLRFERPVLVEYEVTEPVRPQRPADLFVRRHPVRMVAHD